MKRLRHEANAAPAVVAVDGSYRGHCCGFAYLGDTGSWLAGAHDAEPHQRRHGSTLAELLALTFAINHHPYPVTILCDSLGAVETVVAWSRRATRRDAGAPEWAPRRVRALANTIWNRREPLTIEWVPSHQMEPLNEGADTLARLAARSGRHTPDAEVQPRAASIAEGFAAAYRRNHTYGAAS